MLSASRREEETRVPLSFTILLLESRTESEYQRHPVGISCNLSTVFLELADAVLFLDAEPQILTLVRTLVLQLDHFPLPVERTCFEACPNVIGSLNQRGRRLVGFNGNGAGALMGVSLGMSAALSDPVAIESSLLSRLTEFYGVRTGKVLEALASMGPRYSIKFPKSKVVPNTLLNPAECQLSRRSEMKAATLTDGKSQKQSVPFYVPLLNPLVKGLLHLGMPMGPMAPLSVRGRKTGHQRTTPVAIIEMNRNRYVTSVYGISQWVRNLRAAGEAKLAQGWHSENVKAVELSPKKAAPVLREGLRMAPSFSRKYSDATTASPLQDLERDAVNHPVFLLEK